MDEVLGKKVKLDTELERSIIEYRPRVKYEPNKPFTVNLPTEEIIGKIKRNLMKMVRLFRKKSQLNNMINL